MSIEISLLCRVSQGTSVQHWYNETLRKCLKRPAKRLSSFQRTQSAKTSIDGLLQFLGQIFLRACFGAYAALSS